MFSINLLRGALGKELFLDFFFISKPNLTFVKGRYIGENTRSVYDLLSYAKSKNMPGLLVLIGFEKALGTLYTKC